MARHMVVLAALLGVARGTAGQAVDGRVQGATTGQPVAGALLLLMDDGGVERGRTASAAAGAFALQAPWPGDYRLVVLRIGFVRWESPPLRLALGETRRQLIELPEEPLWLGGITVEGESGCRVRPGAGGTLGVLWEEARKALALADLTKRGRQYLFRTVRTERRLSTSLQPLEDARVIGFGVGHWSFESASADTLTRLGFVLADSAGGILYHGPDVDVLFSATFLKQHCFRLQPGGPAELIGLAFEPLRRRLIPDIAGVLWLDRRTAVLRRLEFTYTNLEAWVPRGPAGGSIDYDVLPTGAWVIRQWMLRAPVPRINVRDPTRGKVLGGYVEFVGAVGEVLGADGRVIRNYAREP
jgi:hypothetical protein